MAATPRLIFDTSPSPMETDSPIAFYDEGPASPKRLLLSPHHSRKGTPGRPTSPLARFEAKKLLLSPSRNKTEPTLMLLSASKQSHVVSPSPCKTGALKNLSLTPLKPVSPWLNSVGKDYSPKFSPREPSPLLKSTGLKTSLKVGSTSRYGCMSPADGSSEVSEAAHAKDKRRSVALAQVFGQRRMDSTKRKMADGKTSLKEVVDSPSAQLNGAFSYDYEEGSPLIKDKKAITGKRRSILEIQNYSMSRIKSAKVKEQQGNTFTKIIESPTARANGEGKSPVVSAKPGKRHSILQIQNYSDSRIKSAKAKEQQGKTFTEIIESPTARANGEGESPVESVKPVPRPRSRPSLLQIQPFAQSRIKSARGKEQAGRTLPQIIDSPSAKEHGMCLIDGVDDDDFIV